MYGVRDDTDELQFISYNVLLRLEIEFHLTNRYSRRPAGAWRSISCIADRTIEATVCVWLIKEEICGSCVFVYSAHD